VTATEETHEQVARRWMQHDPMYAQEAVEPVPAPPAPMQERESWTRGDVSILSGGLGLVGSLSCLTLTVQEWWVPLFLGLAAALVAVYGIVRHQANRKGWVAAGLILGAIAIVFGFAAKVSWDDQKCFVEADTWEEMEACDAS